VPAELFCHGFVELKLTLCNITINTFPDLTIGVEAARTSNWFNEVLPKLPDRRWGEGIKGGDPSVEA